MAVRVLVTDVLDVTLRNMLLAVTATAYFLIMVSTKHVKWCKDERQGLMIMVIRLLGVIFYLLSILNPLIHCTYLCLSCSVLKQTTKRQ